MKIGNIKSYTIIIGILLPIFFWHLSHAQQKDFLPLQGSCLGQKPPGMKPEIFAPGIISTKADDYAFEISPFGDGINTPALEGNSFVTADGKYLFFSRKFDIYWVDAKILEEFKSKTLK